MTNLQTIEELASKEWNELNASYETAKEAKMATFDECLGRPKNDEQAFIFNNFANHYDAIKLKKDTEFVDSLFN